MSLEWLIYPKELEMQVGGKRENALEHRIDYVIGLNKPQPTPLQLQVRRV